MKKQQWNKFLLPLLFFFLLTAYKESPTTNTEDKHSTLSDQPYAVFPITVKQQGWGEASLVDIKAVADSVAKTLSLHFRGLTLDTILLENHKTDPITLYKKSANNEYIIQVNIKGRQWAQLSYQFAHEMGHILSNHENTKKDKHQWFEEAICEAVSLFTLANMAQTWQTNPPYPNWKNYSIFLQQYLDDNLAEPHRYLPQGQSYVQWYNLHKVSLQKNATDRKKNEVIGTAIYQQMLIDYNLLSSIHYLNLETVNDSTSFSTYLRQWYKNTPQQSKPSVLGVLQLFEIGI